MDDLSKSGTSTIAPSPRRDDNSFEDEERKLVSKFTHMVKYLQEEIARLNLVVARNISTSRPQTSRYPNDD